MNPTLACFRALVLGSWRERPFRLVLGLLGVGLGVGVTVAVLLANHSALAAFDAGMRLVVGSSTLTVRSEAGRFDEAVFQRVLERVPPGVNVTPVVEGSIRLEGPLETDCTVLGTDVLASAPFQGYPLRDGSQPVQLLEPRTWLITADLARATGWTTGSTASVRLDDRREVWTVAGVLEPAAGQRHLDAHVAFMDLASAQRAFGAAGSLDRIDLAPIPGDPRGFRVDPPDWEAVRLSLRTCLPAGVTAVDAGERRDVTRRMIRSFELNLLALGFISMLLGAYLIFNTLAVGVARRRADIAILRGMGATSPEIFRVFALEGLLLGLGGSVLGLGIGGVLARGALGFIHRTIETLYVTTSDPGLALDPAGCLLAVAGGTALSLLSSVAPAWQASRVAPGLAMRTSEPHDTDWRWPAGLALVGTALCGLAAWLGTWPAIGGFPVAGFAAAFAWTLGGSGLIPLAMRLLAIATRPVVRRLPLVARLGLEHLDAARSRHAVAIAALMVGVGMVIGMSTMIGSFRDTVRSWTRQTLQADLFMGPGSHRGASTRGTLSPATLDLVKGIRGVRAVDAYREVRQVVDGRETRIGSGDLRLLGQHEGLQVVQGGPLSRLVSRLVDHDAVLVSEPFAQHHGTHLGDRLRLSTVSGSRPFEVVGIYRDYGSDQGVVVLDASTFGRVFPRQRGSTSAAIYLKAGARAEEVRLAIDRALGPEARVSLQTSGELRTEVLRIFDDTFAITWALEAIAIVVALLAVAGTLVALVLERRGELVILRSLGFTPGELQAMVLVEAVGLGLIGSGAGTGLGEVLARLLVEVINRQTFGWSIPLVHAPQLALVTCLLVATTAAIAGLWPARLAGRLAIDRQEPSDA
ncbi:MAG: FtsX-like permease family protein [bacterium]|nr:FtsX-like permease family protein [bacterium]